MITVFLLRHGETAWNKLGRVMGRSQVPLGVYGIQQIKKIAPLVATLELDGTYTSLLRGRYNRQCRLGGKPDFART